MTDIPAHIMTGVTKDYQHRTRMSLAAIAAKHGLSVPEALYVLWWHEIPIQAKEQTCDTLPHPAFIRPVIVEVPVNVEVPAVPDAAETASGTIPALYTVDEIAAALRLSVNTIYRHIRLGNLDVLDISPRGSKKATYRVTRESLVKFLGEDPATIAYADEFLGSNG